MITLDEALQLSACSKSSFSDDLELRELSPTENASDALAGVRLLPPSSGFSDNIGGMVTVWESEE